VKENNERVAKVLAFLRSSVVEEKNVQSDYINVQPVYENDGITLKYCVAEKSLLIKLTKIECYEQILTGLLANGINKVHGIEFCTSQLRKHRDTARALAIRAAKEKAVALTSELGVKCGKAQNISANEFGGWLRHSCWPGWYGGYGNQMSQNVVLSSSNTTESADGLLAVGQISVSATVSVSFAIE
jgi:uncharacterized protein YggE